VLRITREHPNEARERVKGVSVGAFNPTKYGNDDTMAPPP